MSLAKNKKIAMTAIAKPENKIIFSSSETSNSISNFSLVCASADCIPPNITKITKIIAVIDSFNLVSTLIENLLLLYLILRELLYFLHLGLLPNSSQIHLARFSL